MTTNKSGPTVQTGVPDRDALLELLNQAYDGWGTTELLQWKYDEYPEFDPEAHCFYIECDGDLAAYRRVFEKRIVTPDGTVPLYILGDTAVNPSYQGQGLYSRLHAVTTGEYNDAGVISTFNRVGNITYNANLDRGWEYRTLPLRLRILDYSTVIAQYATNVVSSDSTTYAGLEAIDRYVNVRTPSGDSIALTERGATRNRFAYGLPIPVPARLLDRCVEIASTPKPEEAVVDMIRDTVRFGSSTAEIQYQRGTAYRVELLTDSDEAPVDELVALCRSEQPSFRRDAADIEHLLRYPDADAVLIYRDDQLTGFAVVGPKSEPLTIEGRVLEFQATDESSESLLIDAIESVGLQRGYDTLVATAPIEHDRWLTVERQVHMWDPETFTNGAAPAIRMAHLGMYDTL
ncbi:GNAT family N-acetyltransferase [Natronorubrum tibetense]|uniref:N-acetyltransferase domain-containing protein n=1 Tax=Natronorubrum tibetense GA33 TaxID=1114856 RepID=L9VKE7_9EURY|nr:GNAT family N-acetyltransferase [Natronorubrum tibetense]ELY37685.1 hypothetical protein C496_19295 [Natronorubrum tibetense GA33]